jgi:hypothetical protein
MMTQLQIRDHLVPYFFKEFGGQEKKFDSEVSKIVVVHPSSSIYNYLKNSMDLKIKTNIIFYLSIDKVKPFRMKGLVFYEQKKVKKPLMIEEELMDTINSFLEDILRSTLRFYIKAYEDMNFKKSDAIRRFMVEYDMEEYGFEYNDLRIMYYRNNNLNRLIHQNSNRLIKAR